VHVDTVVPAFLDGGTWSACFGLSYLDLTLWDLSGPRNVMHGKATYLRKVCGAAGIAEGRNEVAASFLDGCDAEWLWMVDTDMGFGPDTVARLLVAAHPVQRPVVGALAFALRRVEAGPCYSDRYGIIPTLYSWVELDDEVGFAPMRDWPRGKVVQVSGTGAACLLIHRGALQAVRDKYGDAWFDPITHPKALPSGRRTFSEDLSFCVRLQGAGIPVHVDTSVPTVHHKGGIYLDEQAFNTQAIGTQQAATPVEVSA
jgi:hypothetical protein